MNEIEFRYYFTAERIDRLRVRAARDRGAIVGFTVQYEALLGGDWRPIVRYDTAHGFAHKDLLHPGGAENKQPLYFPDHKDGAYVCNSGFEDDLALVSNSL